MENFEQNKTDEKDYKLKRLTFSRDVSWERNFFSAADKIEHPVEEKSVDVARKEKICYI